MGGQVIVIVSATSYDDGSAWTKRTIYLQGLSRDGSVLRRPWGKAAVRTCRGIFCGSILLLAAACAPVTKASNAYEELFAPLEGLQREGREMQRQPLGVVLSGYGAWNHFELGRRLELGQGVPKDPECAAFWYQRADQTEYDYEDWSNPYVRPLRVRRAGIPQARIALRRLRSAGVAAEATERRCIAEQQALRRANP